MGFLCDITRVDLFVLSALYRPATNCGHACFAVEARHHFKYTNIADQIILRCIVIGKSCFFVQKLLSSSQSYVDTCDNALTINGTQPGSLCTFHWPSLGAILSDYSSGSLMAKPINILSPLAFVTDCFGVFFTAYFCILYCLSWHI